MRSALAVGLRRPSRVAFGTLANASSVGAKTVNGPAPESVSTRSAVVTADTKVVRFSALDATSTIVFLSIITSGDGVTVELWV